MPRLTIVIPMQNEAGNVASVIDEVAAAMQDAPEWEIVAVDDGFDRRHRGRAGQGRGTASAPQGPRERQAGGQERRGPQRHPRRARTDRLHHGR